MAFLGLGSVLSHVFKGGGANATKAVSDLAPAITKIEDHPDYRFFKQGWDEFHKLGKQNADLANQASMFASGSVPLNPSKTRELSESGEFLPGGLGVGDWYGMLSYNTDAKALASSQEALQRISEGKKVATMKKVDPTNPSNPSLRGLSHQISASDTLDMTDAQIKMLLRGKPSGLKLQTNLEHRKALAGQANGVLEDSKLQRADISNQMDTLFESNKSLRESMENDIQQ